MKILYFGWVRARIGIGGEDISPPAEISDVRGLVEWLKERGGGYEQALEDISSIRVAVDQELAELDDAIANVKEVALFPPMTGG